LPTVRCMQLPCCWVVPFVCLSEDEPTDAGSLCFLRPTRHSTWVVAICRDVLGPDYKIVEIGVDTPFEGAMKQPWNRDFHSPPETWRDRRITSLAFNLTGVDVTPEMGPFEIAAGTQCYARGNMKCSSRGSWQRFAERGARKFPQMGDISCRSAY
jgi:hypothetical protein